MRTQVTLASVLLLALAGTVVADRPGTECVDRYPGGLPYLDASRASSGSISRTMAQTAAMRAARTAESALLRSASSWSMASATRRRADSSIEHTIEDYQVGDGLGPACRGSVIHRLPTCACGNSMWITHREIHPKFFFRTAGGSRFPCSQRNTCG